MSVANTPPDFRRVWLWPLVIGLTSTIGLISALLGDGPWDMLSWVMLGVPVAIVVGAVHGVRTARRRHGLHQL